MKNKKFYSFFVIVGIINATNNDGVAGDIDEKKLLTAVTRNACNHTSEELQEALLHAQGVRILTGSSYSPNNQSTQKNNCSKSDQRNDDAENDDTQLLRFINRPWVDKINPYLLQNSQEPAEGLSPECPSYRGGKN